MSKFFIPLGAPVEHEGGHQARKIDYYIFGPYPGDTDVAKALSELFPNEKNSEFLMIEGQMLCVPPSPLEKPESEKRAPGNEDNFRSEGDRLICKECGAFARAGVVRHSVHLRMLPLAGSGEVRTRQVAYCPNCDHVPNPNGEPIYED